MEKPVDDPNPELKDATNKIQIDFPADAASLVMKIFMQEGYLRERERIAEWIKANRTEVVEGVYRDHFTSEYLLNHVIPLPTIESVEGVNGEKLDLDYSDFVSLKITRVKSEGKPSYWQVDFPDGSGGTAPTFYGVWDIAFEQIEHDLDGWTDFNANEKEDK